MHNTEHFTFERDAMGGATLTRHTGGADIYFQPGDDAAMAAHALGLADSDGNEMTPRDDIFDAAAADYFSLLAD